MIGNRSINSEPAGQKEAEDNHQGFAETCNEWWENKGYDEKRKIWKEHNDC